MSIQKARFRLNAIAIEGFKGFTDKQDIALSGKHVFLFGENGCGKSSIVEAVRWCLFGLAERPETEVRNAYYALGECNVELELSSSEGKWHIRRSLRPGAERSRLVITDPEEKEVLQSEIFPHLARMGPREGTHIIFAAQQASGRRPQADISDFHKVLYSYLNLEQVPSLLEQFDRLLEEQQSTREEIAKQIGDLEEMLRQKLEGVNLSLDELLRNPPWENSTPPTRSETDAKIHTFVQEIANALGEKISEGPSHQLLKQAQDWLQLLSSSGRDKLQEKIGKLQSDVTSIRSLLQRIAQDESARIQLRKNIQNSKLELGGLCENHTLEELKTKLDMLHQRLVESDAKLTIVKDAEKYLATNPATQCPVCLRECNENELIEKVRGSIGQAAPAQIALSDDFSKLKDKYTRALEADANIRTLESKLQEAGKDQDSAASSIRSILKASDDEQLSDDVVKMRLEEMENAMKSLENSLESVEFKHIEFKKRIDALWSELRFHGYRSEQERLQNQLTVGLKPIHDQFSELVELENTVRDIRMKLNQEFNEAIDRAIPRLNVMMTEVYRNLTKQSSFENISIVRAEIEGKTSLRFRVGSDRIPGQLYDPEDVLNGQANSALRLVPYFVFSEFQAEALELDLLLIDDPSQSFDTSHVDSLLQELAKAGSHAQLIIATHENERFQPLLTKYFASSGYEIITFAPARNFEKMKGPDFVIN